MKKKVKIIAGFTIVCIILSFVISACITKFPSSNSFTIMSIENSSASRLKASYKYFDGTNARKIHLKQGEILKINFTSEVKKGDLVINVLNNNGETLKTLGSDIEGNEEIRAEEDGEYTIRVKGHGTRGRYDVNWSK